MTEERDFFPMVPLGDLTRKILNESPLVLADVGAAHGIDQRWQNMEKWIQFHLFEPDARSEIEEKKNIKIYRCALGEEKGKKKLFLSQLPAASSFYPISEELNRFVIRDWVNPVKNSDETLKKEEVAVDTLDGCGCPLVDFIKLDVEGDELGILKGGAKNLEKSILALQVEVSLSQRFEGGPLFAEVDTFLRGHGFRLHQMATERWKRYDRRNKIKRDEGANFQAMWADVLYVRNENDLLKWVKQEEEDGEKKLCKFILILVAYRAYDYALDVLEEVEKEKKCNLKLIQELRVSIETALAQEKRGLWKDGIIILMGLLLLPVIKWLPPVKERYEGRFGYLFSRSSERLKRILGRQGPEGGIVSEHF